MDVTKIQREVRRLPARDRKKLTAWMVSEFPTLSVDRLMRRASRAVKSGTFSPSPPTEDNYPKNQTLEHALEVAERLGLRK